MDILGLENNYYLANNGIWVQVSGLTKNPLRLELKATNLNTGKTMPVFTLYANLDKVFRFNISQVVRPLQPYPDHIETNSLQSYRLEFVITFDDNTTDATILEKYFLRGGRAKNNSDEWYLADGSQLLVSKWVDWRGIILPGYAQKIMSSLIVDFIPPAADTYKMYLPSHCNAKIIKFLNSLGGYQFWVFESSEIAKKTKGRDSIAGISSRLRSDSFRNLGTESTTDLILKTKTPAELQPLILDLIESPEVLMYDADGTDNESKWQRLQLSGSNDAPINTNDMSYLNEVTYSIPTITNRTL